MLTTLEIKTAKPLERAYKLSDGAGLFLLVQPNGSKLWRYKFRIAGQEGLMALGAFPEVSLADARQAHSVARKLVAQGIHPVQARRQEREERARAQARLNEGSFGVICAQWLDACGAGLKPATVSQRNREINSDLLPKFRERPIESITRLELTTTLKNVEQRAPEVARNLRNHLWGIFEYAIDSGVIENNPVPPIRVLRKRSQAHHPALTPERLSEFLRRLDSLSVASINEQTRIAMWLLILTVGRKTEITNSRWEEFELDSAEWEVPAERMKSGRPHWIPLSRQAVVHLRRLRRIVPNDSAYLFPNRVDPSRPMADRSLNALMERLGFAAEGTPHGMRACFSTHFNRLGHNVDVIEQCLAHVPANRVRAAYNRHAYRPERRTMLQEWADHLDGLRAHAAPS